MSEPLPWPGRQRTLTEHVRDLDDLFARIARIETDPAAGRTEWAALCLACGTAPAAGPSAAAEAYIRSARCTIAEASYATVAGIVRRMVAATFRRYRLKFAPPRAVGLSGQRPADWSDDRATFEYELYRAAVLDRFAGLLALVKGGASVEAAVQQNMHREAHDRQRRANPDGYRLFINVREAVLAREDLEWTGGRPTANSLVRVRGCRAHAGLPVGEAVASARVSARTWSQLTGGGVAGRTAVEAVLGEVIVAGAVEFRLGDLLDELRDRALTVRREPPAQMVVDADEPGRIDLAVPPVAIPNDDDGGARVARLHRAVRLAVAIELRQDAAETVCGVLNLLVESVRDRLGHAGELVFDAVKQVEIADRLGLRRSTVFEAVNRLRRYLPRWPLYGAGVRGMIADGEELRAWDFLARWAATADPVRAADRAAVAAALGCPRREAAAVTARLCRTVTTLVAEWERGVRLAMEAARADPEGTVSAPGAGRLAAVVRDLARLPVAATDWPAVQMIDRCGLPEEELFAGLNALTARLPPPGLKPEGVG